MLRDLLFFALALCAGKAYVLRDLLATTLLRDFTISYLLIIILGGVYQQCIHRWLFSSYRYLPHPKDSSFLLGSAREFLSEPFGVPNLRWQKHFTNGLYRVFLGPATLLVATGPAALISVLGKGNVCVKPEQIRYGLSTTIGHGLVTAEGEDHKAQRKILNPVFRGERGVRTMVPTFWAKALRMRAEIDDVVDDGEAILDVSKTMMRVAFSIIMDTVFGLDLEKDPEREAELLDAWKAALLHGEKQNLLEAFCEGVLPLFVSPKYTDWLLRHTRRNQRSIKGRQVIRDSILDQIHHFKSDNVPFDAQKANLVQMMLNAGVSEETELQGQLMTMLSAGHETTAAALTWGLYALAADQAIQSRLRSEIETQVGQADLTAESMDSMPYLHGFVMEVLRLYPSIMQTVRETTQETMIDGTRVLRGQMILVPIYAINRSEQFWGENAEVLDPTRWSNMNSSGGFAGQHAFMTFLGGSRVCIGKEFSIRSMKAILVSLLSGFVFEEMAPGMWPTMRKDLICQPQGGMELRVRRL